MKADTVATTKGPSRLLSQSVTTLHIEGGSVRLLAVKGRKVMEWGMAPLEPGLMRDGVVVDPKSVGERIKSLLADNRFSNTNLVSGLTGQRCVPRLLGFPRMDSRLLKEAVPREMKRELPVPLEDMHLSWQVIRRENGNLQVFALGVPRDVLALQVEAITLAGGSLLSMDIKPLALVRAVGRSEALIADLEPDSLDVIVVQDGIPATIRTVSLRGEIDTVEDKVRRLGEEVARAVKYYNDTHSEEPLGPLTPVFLTGSLADEAARSAVVETSVGRAVEPLAPPLDYPDDLPLAAFMVNIGLALKGR